MTKKIEKKIPDFIQIPYQLIGDKNLAPIDRLVYGAIYFYSKMSGERCFATNNTVAKLLHSTPKTVGRSLQKLEDARYIIRDFSDPDTKKNRTEIIPLVAMSKLTYSKSRVPPNGGTKGQIDVPLNGGTVPPNGGLRTSKQGYPKNGVNLTEKNEEMALNKDEMGVVPPNGVPPNGGVIESIERIDTENKKKDYWARPSDDTQNVPRPTGDFTNMVRSLSRFDSIEKVPEQEVSDGIALFLPVFPDQFVTKNPFAVPANRMAVKKILMRLTLAELREVVDKYVSKKGDPYRPEAATIATFCNFKMDRIEAFVRKNAGGLWAHRSISTPAQRADSDKLISDIIEKGREKTRKAKEDWLRDHPEA
jgi:hypothetical protein